MVNLYLPSLYSTFDPGLTVTVNFIFTLREPNVYKPHGFFLGSLRVKIKLTVTVRPGSKAKYNEGKYKLTNYID